MQVRSRKAGLNQNSESLTFPSKDKNKYSTTRSSDDIGEDDDDDDVKTQMRLIDAHELFAWLTTTPPKRAPKRRKENRRGDSLARLPLPPPPLSSWLPYLHTVQVAA